MLIRMARLLDFIEDFCAFMSCEGPDDWDLENDDYLPTPGDVGMMVIGHCNKMKWPFEVAITLNDFREILEKEYGDFDEEFWEGILKIGKESGWVV
jgi:hypothetical protein